MTINLDYLKRWPKTRPKLPIENQKVYESEYILNRERKTITTKISGGMETWMHKKVASKSGKRILELGAGALNHIDYEKNYVTYDIIEPFRKLYDSSPKLQKINHVYSDISEVPPNILYDKIISVAVLEHLTELPAVLCSLKRHLKKDGIFQAAIPAEGGLLWGLSWRCTTGLAYRLRTGASYAPLMKHEHVNQAIEIESIIRYYFDLVTIKRFILPWRHLAFYEYIEAVKSDG